MRTSFVVILCALASLPARAGDLKVVLVSPPRHSTAPIVASISIVFDRPVDTETIDSTTFRVFGRSSGTPDGKYKFSGGDRIATFMPDDPFFRGETVLVNVSSDVVAADSTPLRGAGYAYRFETAVSPASRSFTLLDVVSVEDGGPPPRIYGALASDFDGDRWVDLGVVNSAAADVRVLLNAREDGEFDDFLVPPTSVGNLPSPNEPADFDNDGRIDACIANSGASTISIILGDGDGAFDADQQVAVGSNPRGLAVLDADGDADLDIATLNLLGNNVSLSLNDGSGVFGPSTTFEGGGDGEFAMAAADMNNDGITDLVVGARTSQQIIVHLGNGDGTFTQAGTQDGGGVVWLIVCGDVDGDGNMDVSTANGDSFGGAILMGQGDGTLGPPAFMPMDGLTNATDLGDLDGDGDLDWVLSSFGAGHWRLFTNDGSGNFTFDQQFDAPERPACAVMLDSDRDGDLDLTLLDEISNEVILMKNHVTGDEDGDGTANPDDCDPADEKVWDVPGEVVRLDLFHTGGPGGTTVLSWNAPALLGGKSVIYDAIRSETRDDFTAATPSAVCLETHADDLHAIVPDTDTPSYIFYYLIRARNDCGAGTAGAASSSAVRDDRSCD